jgi:TolA-binding protein
MGYQIMIMNRWWMATLAVTVCIAPLSQGADSTSDEPQRNGSLSALERRALMAQALVQQVKRLESKILELQEEIESQKEEVKSLTEKLKLSEEKIESQKDLLEERDEQLKKQKEMLAIFRSGSFEYYEVSDGDTVASIAAKPMIYGDASRAPQIEQANEIKPNEELLSGTILIIPRYPEGIIHDL